MTAIVIEQIINGLLVGSYYIVLALGLSMIFSLGGVVNLAHGAFYAVGAYFAYEIQKFAGFGGAVVLSPICVALLGVAIERAFLQRLYREDPMLGLLFTFGLALTIEQSLRLIWGTTHIKGTLEYVLFDGWLKLDKWAEPQRRIALRALVDALPHVKTSMDLDALVAFILQARGGGELKIEVPDTSARIDVKSEGPNGATSYSSQNVKPENLARAAQECQKALRQRYPDLQ